MGETRDRLCMVHLIENMSPQTLIMPFVTYVGLPTFLSRIMCLLAVGMCTAACHRRQRGSREGKSWLPYSLERCVQIVCVTLPLVVWRYLALAWRYAVPVFINDSMKSDIDPMSRTLCLLSRYRRGSCFGQLHYNALEDSLAILISAVTSSSCADVHCCSSWLSLSLQ